METHRIGRAATLPVWRALVAATCIVLIGAFANAALIHALVSVEVPPAVAAMAG